MDRSVEVIRGDVPGTDHRFTVLRFAGDDPSAPTAYLQAALHGNELPGVAALHALVPMLTAAEAGGRIRGRITIVPQANPIAAHQHLFGEHAGRFALGTRTNFNRDFPLLATDDPSALPGDGAPIFAEKRLKARLLSLALGHDLVLDLHCDDEGLSYLYVPAPLWPHMADLASALQSAAVILWHDSSDGAFEEAAFSPYRSLPADHADWRRRAISTVELRGRADVSPDLAAADAAGLYRFLVARGVIADDSAEPLPAWTGLAARIDHVEMLRAPSGGPILYHVRPGDRVAEGDLLAEILAAPGEAGGALAVVAPQDGLVLTRRAHRLGRIGDDLLKLIAPSPSRTAGSGALED